MLNLYILTKQNKKEKFPLDICMMDKNRSNSLSFSLSLK